MKTYDTKLACGCMIAHDTGFPESIQGDNGMMPCYAEYGTDKKAERLCEESYKKHSEECEQC